MAEVDYGYGDAGAEDYGYGDANPDQDYGYGDASPDQGYGYGDASPDQDYGYGDASPDQDYGYGDASPDEPAAPEPVAAAQPPRRKGPKRRCSITKFSLEEGASCSLNSHNIIDQFRNNANAPVPQAVPEPETVDVEPVKSAALTDTTLSCASSDDEKEADAHTEMRQAKKTTEKEPYKKKERDMMKKLRKRLSIFN